MIPYSIPAEPGRYTVVYELKDGSGWRMTRGAGTPDRRQTHPSGARTRSARSFSDDKEREHMSIYEKLAAINVNGHTEKKNGLTYLSWAWAWAEVKKAFPNATYTIYENANGWFYHTDGKTAWVKTGVTIEGIEHIEYLPVMDNRNRSIPVANITSFDVNKAIQRSLTKACARHGLGLYIYAGEDLPDGEEPEQAQARTTPARRAAQKATVEPVKQETLVRLEKALTGRIDTYDADYVCRWAGVENLTQLTEGQALNVLAVLERK